MPQADAVGTLGPSETGTNTQEIGIDEPDIAKLSGTTLFRVQGKALRSYDVSGDSAELLDEIELEGGSNTQLLIAGDKALVTWDDYDNKRDTPIAYVAEVDISDPAAMSVLRMLELDGANVSARLQGSTARLVIQSQPQLPRPGQGIAGAGAASDGGRRCSHGRDRRNRPRARGGRRARVAAAGVAARPRDGRARHDADRRLRRRLLPR